MIPTTRPLLAALVLAGGVAAYAVPAHACPAGYKRVWIQGNPVCRLDASASSSLKTSTKGDPTFDPSTAKGPRRTVR
jgi:hypothetical protein